MSELVYKQESYQIMGAAFEVYKEKGKQIINYLKSTGKELGLLINFGHFPKVQYERFVNQENG